MATTNTTSILHHKAQLITTYLLPLLSPPRSRPFFLGVSGIQGSGKTTICTLLSRALSSAPHNLRVATLSIDDIYLPNSTLTSLSFSHPQNPFLQQRGAPGTHDVELGVQVLDALRAQRGTVRVPAYDKSLFHGQGDRVPEELWCEAVLPLDVVILEGWCVGFRKLGEGEVERRWRESAEGCGRGRLGRCRLEDVLWMNAQLEAYDEVWDRMDALVHIDAGRLEYVYEWRTEQEHAMIKKGRTGMTDEQVRAFVDSYMPAYELYLDDLRQGAFKRNILTSNTSQKGIKSQLRMIIGKERDVISAIKLAPLRGHL